MTTWGEVKKHVEDAGVKDDDTVRGFEFFFSLDRPDFSHMKMTVPAERTISVSPHQKPK